MTGTNRKNVLIIGDGGWGTAVAVMLADKGVGVRLWSNFPEQLREIERRRENRRFLRGVKIPHPVEYETDPERAANGVDLFVSAVPTQYAGKTLAKFRGLIKNTPVVSLSKGIEIKTFRRPSEIIAAVVGTDNVAVLSGPSHAEEVARRLPTSVTVAACSKRIAKFVQDVFMSPVFRVYTSSDVVGVELAGALKNVIAVAAGICDGIGFGDNSKSALMTRGLAEMMRFGCRFGARKETFAGLAGIGDLITTCVSPHGRNRRVGELIGSGKSLRWILASSAMVAEGVPTARAVHAIAVKKKIDMPITREVNNILFKRKDPRKAVQDLMERGAKEERI